MKEFCGTLIFMTRVCLKLNGIHLAEFPNHWQVANLHISCTNFSFLLLCSCCVYLVTKRSMKDMKNWNVLCSFLAQRTVSSYHNYSNPSCYYLVRI